MEFLYRNILHHWALSSFLRHNRNTRRKLSLVDKQKWPAKQSVIIITHTLESLQVLKGNIHVRLKSWRTFLKKKGKQGKKLTESSLFTSLDGKQLSDTDLGEDDTKRGRNIWKLSDSHHQLVAYVNWVGVFENSWLSAQTAQ